MKTTITLWKYPWMVLMETNVILQYTLGYKNKIIYLDYGLRQTKN